eukprot:63705_1
MARFLSYWLWKYSGIVLMVSGITLLLVPFVFFPLIPNEYTRNIDYNNVNRQILNELHLNYTTFNLLTHGPEAIASLEENFRSKISSFMDLNNIRFVSYHRHFMNGVHFNIGDFYSSPFLYFPFLSSKLLTTGDPSRVDRDHGLNEILSNLADEIYQNDYKIFVIVGGGGLLEEYFQERLIQAYEFQMENKFNILDVYLFGIGTNNRMPVFKDATMLYDIDIRNFSNIILPQYAYYFTLSGVRDFIPDYSDHSCLIAHSKYNTSLCYNTDASCFKPEILLYYNNTKHVRKIGFYFHIGYNPFHRNTALGLCYKDLIITNGTNRNVFYNEDDTENYIDNILLFLSESEYVVTTSYHGLYWSTLLGKKVIVCRPWSYKFVTFKYKPAYSTGDFEKDKLHARQYLNALHESRRYVLDFYWRMLQHMKHRLEKLSNVTEKK